MLFAVLSVVDLELTQFLFCFVMQMKR